jgi:hypothetical protein
MTFFSPFGSGTNPSGGIGPSNVQAVGSAASDLFAGFAAGDKIKGDLAEGASYTEAAQLAEQNVQITAMSTAIQEVQQQRELYMSMGRTTAAVAGAGFANSGSALDILRSSAQQGALKSAVIGQQGLATEAGYQEQAASYDAMAAAASSAAHGEQTARIGDFVAAGISAVAAVTPA